VINFTHSAKIDTIEQLHSLHQEVLFEELSKRIMIERSFAEGLYQYNATVRGVPEGKCRTGGHGARQENVNELYTKRIPFRLKGEVVALRPTPHPNLNNKTAYTGNNDLDRNT
jgi:hypothetical protein